MKNHPSTRDLLMLYDSDELSALERQQVEDLLKTSAEAKKELAAIRKLHGHLGEIKQFEPEVDTLHELRRNLSERLRTSRQPLLWWQRIRGFSILGRRSAPEFGLAVAALLLGILVGRAFFPRVKPAPADTAEILNKLVTGAPVTSAGTTLAPELANVHLIQFDRVTDQVQVEFSTVNRVRLRGTIDDPVVRQLLAYAMREEANPGLRLKAVRIMNEAAPGQTRVAGDDELIGALLHLLAHDPNDGVRLKALQVLKKMPLTQLIKRALIQTLLRDPNAAVRIATLDSLSNQEFMEDDTAAFEAAAATDANAYVRLRARQLLGVAQQEVLY